MGDTIFDYEDNNEVNAATGVDQGVNGTVTLTTEQWEALQKEQQDLRSSLASVNQKLEDTTRMLGEQNAPPKEAPRDGSNMTADQALAEFAKDPSQFTSMVADGRISKAVSEQLAPLLNPIIQTTHTGIVQSQRQAFDTKFGVGKFDEIILPTLQSDLDQLQQSNPNSITDENTVKALVDRISGQKREEINEAEKSAADSRKEAEQQDVARVVAALPPSMQPRPTEGVKEVSEEAKTMFDEIERATGERPDESRFLAVHNAKPGIDGYVNAVKEIDTSGKDAGTGA